VFLSARQPATGRRALEEKKCQMRFPRPADLSTESDKETMAQVAVADLSSNWKRLQQSLKPKPKPEDTKPAVKRKRAPESQDEKFKSFLNSSNGSKKPRTELNKPSFAQRKTKMGGAVSKLSTSTPRTASNATSTTPAEDVVSTRTSTDSLVNQGLHPTHKPGKFLAIDCEMVGTGPLDDNVLARVSIVNFHGEQIYDSFVQPVPGIEVTDYRTFVSGIRPHHLKPDVARTFSEVQKDVAALLDGKILIGHALKNDLDVLLLSHPKRDIRDTSRHSTFRKMSMGRAPALRKLAKEFLGMDIQGGEHSSVEDARATMMLFKLEKEAFEKEVKQKYGAAIRREEKMKQQAEDKKARKEEQRQAKENAEDSDEDEDEDESDNEDEEQLDNDGNVIAPSVKKSKKSKKNKKRKKRTKRA
jgi:RNA exonuclease 4